MRLMLAFSCFVPRMHAALCRLVTDDPLLWAPVLVAGDSVFGHQDCFTGCGVAAAYIVCDFV